LVEGYPLRVEQVETSAQEDGSGQLPQVPSAIVCWGQMRGGAGLSPQAYQAGCALRDPMPDPAICRGCAKCAVACPHKAIELM